MSCPGVQLLKMSVQEGARLLVSISAESRARMCADMSEEERTAFTLALLELLASKSDAERDSILEGLATQECAAVCQGAEAREDVRQRFADLLSNETLSPSLRFKLLMSMSAQQRGDFFDSFSNEHLSALMAYLESLTFAERNAFLETLSDAERNLLEKTRRRPTQLSTSLVSHVTKTMMLRKAPIFVGAPMADLRALSKTAQVKSLDEGGCLIRQGEVVSALYFVVRGSLAVSADVDDKNEAGTTEQLQIAELQAGCAVAEIGVLTGQLASATYCAKTEAILLEISKKTLRQLMRERPSLRACLQKFAAESEVAAFTAADLVIEREDKVQNLLTFSLVPSPERQKDLDQTGILEEDNFTDNLQDVPSSITASDLLASYLREPSADDFGMRGWRGTAVLEEVARRMAELFEGLPETELQDEVMRAFNCIDTDGGGTLDQKEFQAAFEWITGKHLTDRELNIVFTEYDTDGSGEIDLSEFRHMIMIFLKKPCQVGSCSSCQLPRHCNQPRTVYRERWDGVGVHGDAEVAESAPDSVSFNFASEEAMRLDSHALISDSTSENQSETRGAAKTTMEVEKKDVSQIAVHTRAEAGAATTEENAAGKRLPGAEALEEPIMLPPPNQKAMGAAADATLLAPVSAERIVDSTSAQVFSRSSSDFSRTDKQRGQVQLSRIRDLGDVRQVEVAAIAGMLEDEHVHGIMPAVGLGGQIAERDEELTWGSADEKRAKEQGGQQMKAKIRAGVGRNSEAARNQTLGNDLPQAVTEGTPRDDRVCNIATQLQNRTMAQLSRSSLNQFSPTRSATQRNITDGQRPVLPPLKRSSSAAPTRRKYCPAVIPITHLSGLGPDKVSAVSPQEALATLEHQHPHPRRPKTLDFDDSKPNGPFGCAGFEVNDVERFHNSCVEMVNLLARTGRRSTLTRSNSEEGITEGASSRMETMDAMKQPVLAFTRSTSAGARSTLTRSNSEEGITEGASSRMEDMYAMRYAPRIPDGSFQTRKSLDEHLLARTGRRSTLTRSNSEEGITEGASSRMETMDAMKQPLFAFTRSTSANN